MGTMSEVGGVVIMYLDAAQGNFAIHPMPPVDSYQVELATAPHGTTDRNLSRIWPLEF